MLEIRMFKHGEILNLENQVVGRRRNQHEMTMKTYGLPTKEVVFIPTTF